jgi:hypothetical protein
VGCGELGPSRDCFSLTPHVDHTFDSGYCPGSIAQIDRTRNCLPGTRRTCPALGPVSPRTQQSAPGRDASISTKNLLTAGESQQISFSWLDESFGVLARYFHPANSQILVGLCLCCRFTGLARACRKLLSPHCTRAPRSISLGLPRGQQDLHEDRLILKIRSCFSLRLWNTLRAKR